MYSKQTVLMIGYATITFSYDPDGQINFPLIVWITKLRTQILLGIDFCQKQVSGINFNLPGIEIKNLRSQFAMVAFTKTSPILIHYKV